jgi:hypothetical protein
MYQSRNIAPVFARNAKFTVQLEPYSLEPGRVGESIFKPVVMSRHRSARQARLALIRLINGSDNGAREYLRACGAGIALRYVARETSAPFKAYSANDLRALTCGAP